MPRFIVRRLMFIGDWRHAGPVRAEMRGERVVLHAQLGSESEGAHIKATEFITTTEQVYAQVTADLGLTTTLAVVVDLCDDASSHAGCP